MKAISTFFAALLFVGAGLAHTVLPDDAVPSVTPDVPFRLIDQHGDTFTDADLIGQPTAVFFGFTSCPDVCPMTLANLGAMLEALGPSATGLRVVMVTVDSENDTPAVMRDYLASFDPTYIGLTGHVDQAEAAANRFYVAHSRINGVISHSASIYLLDRSGQIRDAIFYTESTATALPKLRALLGKAAE
jgi:protein SCO1/2